MHIIEVLEAKDKLTSLLDEVAGGGEVLIIRDGKPVAKLIPAEPGFDRVKAKQAADGLRELGAKQTLGGISIKELITEGRR